MSVEGWGLPGLSRKWHYFRDARSLCGKWFFPSDQLHADDDNVVTSNDCALCTRRRGAERKRSVDPTEVER